MIVADVKSLLERLTGQPAPFEVTQELALFENDQSNLGYSQLNELLLLFGFDRITHAFFRFLLDGQTTYETGQAFTSRDQLAAGVARFRKLAILLYGNVKFAFKLLSRDSVRLVSTLEASLPISPDLFTSRHDPILPVAPITPDDSYLTGYIIERELKARLANNADDRDAAALELRRQEVVARAKLNQVAYLASDHLDVYVATSMRERHEFLTVARLAKEIFEHDLLRPLKLRWFDPTQAYCVDRIDKGLSEALMLRRAECTIYLAQESDTLGKDSELASTLAQGKPVIAFVPQITDQFFEAYYSTLAEVEAGANPADILLRHLQVFEPGAPWTDPEIRKWCATPETIDLGKLRSRLQSRMKDKYDSRANILDKTHPLGIQVNLATGVANGVLVVRSVNDCARLVRQIITQTLEFELEETDNAIILKESISGSAFRVVTKDQMLTNTFWNFYLNRAE